MRDDGSAPQFLSNPGTLVKVPWTILPTIADKINELQEAAPIELLGAWLMSTQSAEVPYVQYNSITCSICLDPVLNHHPVHTLRCRHVFHDLCLERWFLRGHNSCPLCQKALVEVCDICQHWTGTWGPTPPLSAV
ncbi:RING finger protein [Aspergillus fumigatus A1163]|uniref:RING finger protein n=1 Tax=Aspergillus fumigatus (strain CBS 144.89 / FGSC A1163 / CEA10) TaxID=451804 RepID=B0Y597_ASPFC|nr:RING finger protein [Aspergillus fumigatus A1163]